MKKSYLITLVVIIWIFLPEEPVSAGGTAFEYPYYLIDSYNPEGNCWTGMDPNGHWPVRVIPKELLIGEPPAINVSGVTIPADRWIELMFCGEIVDGPGDDIFVIELDEMGEQSLIFVTDGADQEYLLGLASVPNTGEHGPRTIGFDIAGIPLPFVPRAIRILGIDFRGGSPGFDIAYARARISSNCHNAACNPSPPNGVRDVSVDTVLKWSPGYSAQKHSVFFGTDLADVGPDAAPIQNPAQPQEANSYDPGGLELDTTYYWRIDEVNESGNYVRTGEVWKFKTTDHYVVDDFESYSEFTFYNSWIPISYAYLELSRDLEPSHSCRQAVSFSYYYDDQSYSEAKYTFDSPQNWSSMGAKFLELYFHGTANSDPYAQMYFVIDDGSIEKVIPYTGDVNDVKREVWQPWRIDLQNLNDVDFSNIQSIFFGFCKNQSYPMESGYGLVYFDDIRLYPSSCLQEHRPDADFDGDCTVGFKDLEEMSDRWLDSGYKKMTVSVPAAPRAWYKFDDNADDSAGSYHGRLSGNPTFVPGIHNRAVKFDGYKDSVMVSHAAGLFSKINTGITITFWASGTNSIHHTDTIFCTNFSYNLYNPAIAINLGCWKQPGRYNWDCGSPWSFDNRLSGDHKYKAEWAGRWNHWAFTKDVIAEKMQIYLNGELFDSKKSTNTPIAGVNSFEIGSGWYGGYDGLIDDFRIYDYALSQPEIAYIVTNGTGILDMPLITPADLFPDNYIDFKDFAVLADSWLEKELYP